MCIDARVQVNPTRTSADIRKPARASWSKISPIGVVLSGPSLVTWTGAAGGRGGRVHRRVLAELRGALFVALCRRGVARALAFGERWHSDGIRRAVAIGERWRSESGAGTREPSRDLEPELAAMHHA